MADALTTPAVSPLSMIEALFGSLNKNQQRQAAATPDNHPNVGPGYAGPSYTPGGVGFGQYEGDIRTPANPSGTVLPSLGAANPPAGGLYNAATPQTPMPRPRPPVPVPTSNPWAGNMPPTDVSQLGAGGPMSPNPSLPGATAPQPTPGSPSLPFSPQMPGPMPFMGGMGGGAPSWASSYMQPQGGNAMTRALFSSPQAAGGLFI